MSTQGYDPSEDRGPLLMGVCYAFYALTLIIYIARMSTRVYPKFSMTAADYTITMAMICKTISLGFMASAVAHGFGKHTVFIHKEDMHVLGDHLFGVYLTSMPASAFARISIACLLLQFTTRRGWRALIWVTIVMQVLICVLYYVVQFVNCGSVLAAKLKFKDSQCLSPSHVWGFTYASVSVSMVSDLICATIPIFIIWRLSRSRLERILVCILMASSLLASAIGIPKLYYMITFDFTSKDGFYIMWDEIFWSRLEEAIIIMAACAPLLKIPIERLLIRLGLPTLKVPERELNEISASSGQYSTVKDRDSSLTWLPNQRPDSRQSDPSQVASSDQEYGARNDPELGLVRYPEQAVVAGPKSQ